MSHITKILLKIIMLRIRNKIKPEIAEEECGFVEDKGTSNAIYILRTLIERALEVQFDRVRHDEIITQLKQLNIDGKDLRIIKTMYWEQTAAMRIENKTSTFQDIKRGVRQGCVLSPDLFSLYSEIIMRNLENHPGIKKPQKVVAESRLKQVAQLVSHERGETITMLGIINAIGNSLPPCLVFPRKQFKPHMIFGAPPGTHGFANPSGWMTKQLFVECLRHIHRHVRSTPEIKVLVILDNHESHISIEAVDYCRDNGIVLLSLPPHCSHKMQPLDRTIFGPLKMQYNKAINSWIYNHP
ncbi:LOW QUALITY PROTEIN: tigger transposable element-derived protein 6 [Plakobranchus ocellatus]|uniref:Tigger transposable element-derived protein 6 n=1 Tax=Plakobranchus ocellatus TaxID=259542 RepID=A0AAV4BFM5_9GAST|nr:LOW QUALITY PROTEIN: tigger transposable element-derived protein 6 [Plakobranchus ocellatus]